MRKKIRALLAVGLLCGPVAADAYTITISGTPSSDGKWNITEQFGTFAGLSHALEAQEWWGDFDLAGTFAEALNGGLGYPNAWVFDFGPMFAFSQWLTYGFNARICREEFPQCDAEDIGADARFFRGYFATAEFVPEPAPEPGTLALLGLGLAGLGLSRQRRAA